MVTATLIAVGVLLVVGVAERRHGARVARVARLAFGESARPARWASSAPYIRCAAVTAAAWGAAALAGYDPVHIDKRPTKAASKHLLICLDVSPSMMLKDAGPEPEKVSRGAWAGKLVQGILDRLDTETTRVTLFAFYTGALPVVQETFDKEVIRNALDGLPMYVAFESGPTDMHKGVAKSLEHARIWPRRSAMLVVVSDGDASANQAPLSRPDSVADTIVIGVGDPFKSSVINGHSSRQDASSLKQLAARLGGIYHDGNQKHLPSSILDNLSLTSPRAGPAVGLREAALVALGSGASVLALLGPALVLFGRPRAFRRQRAQVGRRVRRGDAPSVVPIAALEASA